jgi:FAD:protein FMN transferase
LQGGLALLSQHRVRVLQPLWVDLGGIAKGYAVDCAVERLQALGVEAGLVNAGGDMRAFGGVAHPVHLRFFNRLMQVASLQNGALASSSNAELSPIETPHIDPRTGRSACSTHTVVVQARSAAVADALTKVALLCPATADKICTVWQAEWRAFSHVTEGLL